MIEVTCASVREAAAEFALDILEPAERSAIAAHILRCPACRAEIDAMAKVSDRLLELVPGTEPPLGFDRRVLARVGGSDATAGGNDGGHHLVGRRHRGARRPRPRVRMALASAAAALAIVFGLIGWMAGRSSGHHPAQTLLTAQFHQGSLSVGEVDAYRGNPPWFNMTVHGAKGTGTVTCELISKDGRITNLGSFDLVGGSGSWGAPDPAGVAGVAGVQLVDAGGHVVATATFQ